MSPGKRESAHGRECLQRKEPGRQRGRESGDMECQDLLTSSFLVGSACGERPSASPSQGGPPALPTPPTPSTATLMTSLPWPSQAGGQEPGPRQNPHSPEISTSQATSTLPNPRLRRQTVLLRVDSSQAGSPPLSTRVNLGLPSTTDHICWPGASSSAPLPLSSAQPSCHRKSPESPCPPLASLCFTQ